MPVKCIEVRLKHLMSGIRFQGMMNLVKKCTSVKDHGTLVPESLYERGCCETIFGGVAQLGCEQH